MSECFCLDNGGALTGEPGPCQYWNPCQSGVPGFRDANSSIRLCCVGNDQCGADGICYSPQVAEQAAQGLDTRSGYYRGSCTDESYNDPICSQRCPGTSNSDIAYDRETGTWQCCQNDGSLSTANCSVLLFEDSGFSAYPPERFPGPTNSFFRASNTQLTALAGIGSTTISTDNNLATLITSITSDAGGSSFIATVTTTVTAPTSTNGLGIPTTANPQRPANPGDDSSSTSGGEIAGIIVGVIFGVLILLGGGFGIAYWIRKRKRQAQAAQAGQPETTQIPPENAPPQQPQSQPMLGPEGRGTASTGTPSNLPTANFDEIVATGKNAATGQDIGTTQATQQIYGYYAPKHYG